MKKVVAVSLDEFFISKIKEEFPYSSFSFALTMIINRYFDGRSINDYK